MDFSAADITIFQTDTGFTFEFSPLARAVLFAEAGQIANTPAFSNDFNFSYRANNLEVHCIKCYQRGAESTSSAAPVP